VVWAKQSPAQVLAYVNDFQPDLVVKDVQHISLLDRTFHRPLDWLLLRDCPACLHLVTDARHPKPLKVLAAIDLSHLEELTYGLNEQILELASTLARTCDAQLHLLNVSNWSVMGDTVMSVPTQSLDSSWAKRSTTLRWRPSTRSPNAMTSRKPPACADRRSTQGDQTVCRAQWL
jgi:universal stress protein E